MANCIKLPRSLLHTTPLTLWVYANLLAIADENGCASISVCRWGEEIGVTYQQLRTALNRLEITKEITIEATKRMTYIFLCETESCTDLPQRKQQRKQQPIAKSYLDFVDPPFADAFTIWLDYKKKQFKFEYKTERSLKAAYTELVKLSGGSHDVAMQIVEQSMSNGWKGLFELRNNGKRQGNNTTDRYASEREANRQRVDNGLRAAMDVIARENGF